MPYIIGTAGHIDHGKTSLVKALTGEDTDRLKEEKERGISIDLGFAHFDLPDGSRAGVVDVPGHERFIRNMLAGAHGIDLVLFTVAADDGVMPQTEEHLDILHVLGISRAIFVITKADLASGQRLQEVEDEINVLMAGTSLDGSQILPFSALTGQGLDELRRQIVLALQHWQKPASGAYFRLPVDRVFVLQGHGVVVTGTALDGDVTVGERVRCLPGNQLLRVRSLQVHNDAVTTATRGQRVALNLTGQDKVSLERGDVICHEKITLTSARFDAFVDVRPSATLGLKNHQRVRIHVGTAERLGKVILLGAEEKAGPKQSLYCQFVLSPPVLALRGDHFVIRDETAQRTLGGGVVLHPWAQPHHRSDPDLRRRLELLHHGTPADLVEVFLDESDEFALPLAPLHQFLNRTEDDTHTLLQGMSGVRGFAVDEEKLYSTARKWKELTEALVKIVTSFHATHPLAAGMDMEELRDRLPYRTSPRLFRTLLDELTREKVVARDASVVRRSDHAVRLRADEQALVDRIIALLRANPLGPPDVKQIEQEIGAGRARFNEIVRVMERQGSIVRVSPDLYFLRDALDAVKSTLCEHLREKSDITPTVFRDLFGTSRKYTIPLLEYFDREGTTVRVGNTRRLKSATVNS